MLHFLPGFILAPINILLFIVNTVWWGGLVCLLALPKLLLPYQPWRNAVTTLMERCVDGWTLVNLGILRLSNQVQWDVQGLDGLKKDGWYLIMANHLSGLDIIVLFTIARGRMPLPRFFIKHELLHVPFMGWGCWALDMPFMRRYSTGYLKRHPEKKGQDIETTRRACEKLRHRPTTMINFVEGTRFTPEKQKKRRSPYRHLLPPKAGGIAFTLATMGQLFDKVLDVTLAYPECGHGKGKVTWAALSGRLTKVVVRIDAQPADQRVIGDYFGDVTFKRQFQGWLSERWQRKDALLGELNK
ncbi:acyltransferase [Gallaecimonas sp. GXIMD4217]|uniref:acyltransferase n=1 Tax=Gallaecimonas sp. GXIMD4217 TaxID=3131927 RepID=UPI00311B219C